MVNKLSLASHFVFRSKHSKHLSLTFRVRVFDTGEFETSGIFVKVTLGSQGQVSLVWFVRVG
jgi:hypothetical protein